MAHTESILCRNPRGLVTASFARRLWAISPSQNYAQILQPTKVLRIRLQTTVPKLYTHTKRGSDRFIPAPIYVSERMTDESHGSKYYSLVRENLVCKHRSLNTTELGHIGAGTHRCGTYRWVGEMTQKEQFERVDRMIVCK